jgi:hypothetical protein
VAQEEDGKAQTQKETQAPALAAPQKAVEGPSCRSKERFTSWPPRDEAYIKIHEAPLWHAVGTR